MENTEPKKKALDVEIYRKDGKTIFKFSVDPKIEKLYHEVFTEIRESGSWPGLKFYYCPGITQDETYQSRLRNYRLVDDFGAPLFKEGSMNIAWIRTVGGQGEIKVSSQITLAQVATLFRGATAFIKEHWEESFRDFRIKGAITFEV